MRHGHVRGLLHAVRLPGLFVGRWLILRRNDEQTAALNTLLNFQKVNLRAFQGRYSISSHTHRTDKVKASHHRYVLNLSNNNDYETLMLGSVRPNVM